MIWYSPELDEFMIILIAMDQIDFDVTNTRFKFICEHWASPEKTAAHAWFYIGEL